MSDQFVAEIRIFGFNFPPQGWAACNGALLPISQNTALFSLLGTTYGGDGRTTFALPNLQGASPLGWGSGPGLTPRNLGDVGGEAAVTLTATELPAHTHPVSALAAPGTAQSPTGALWAEGRMGRAAVTAYAPRAGGAVALGQASVATAGGGTPHDNMPPYLALNFCIALNGIFPARQ